MVYNLCLIIQLPAGIMLESRSVWNVIQRVSYSSILLPCTCLEIEKLDPGILSSLILYLLLKENL